MWTFVLRQQQRHTKGLCPERCPGSRGIALCCIVSQWFISSFLVHHFYTSYLHENNSRVHINNKKEKNQEGCRGGGFHKIEKKNNRTFIWFSGLIARGKVCVCVCVWEAHQESLSLVKKWIELMEETQRHATRVSPELRQTGSKISVQIPTRRQGGEEMKYRESGFFVYF